MITNFYAHIVQKNPKVALALLQGKRVPLEHGEKDNQKSIEMSLLIEDVYGMKEDYPQFQFHRGVTYLGGCDMELGGCISEPGTTPDDDDFELMDFCTKSLERILAVREFSEKMWQVRDLAKQFSQRLHVDLGIDTVKEIVRLNRLEQDHKVCHTHDFTDANEVMFDAFCASVGRAPDLQSNKDTDLINFAWNVAKHNDFNEEKI